VEEGRTGPSMVKFIASEMMDTLVFELFTIVVRGTTADNIRFFP
jgi:hypothetical protein